MAFNIKAWAAKKGTKAAAKPPKEVDDAAHEVDAKEPDEEDDEAAAEGEAPTKKPGGFAAFIKRKRAGAK